MLIVALVLAVIGLAALVTAVVTSNELIAWVCIAASSLGVILLIVDAIRERQFKRDHHANQKADNGPEHGGDGSGPHHPIQIFILAGGSGMEREIPGLPDDRDHRRGGEDHGMDGKTGIMGHCGHTDGKNSQKAQYAKLSKLCGNTHLRPFAFGFAELGDTGLKRGKGH